MAYSGVVAGSITNVLTVVDHAFRRCRLPAQAITAEMQHYALQSLRFMLSELANIKTPSWCIEKVILPMQENRPVVTLPPGTVDVLNLNYRTIQMIGGVQTTTTAAVTTYVAGGAVVSTVGIEWAATSVPVVFEVSNDNLTWSSVGSCDVVAAAGEVVWVDVDAPAPGVYFRVRTTSPSLSVTGIALGNLPQEIPLGQLNRDAYVNQSNKVFPGRPSNYYFQRDLPDPVVNLWPAPFAAAEHAQLILWRHRQIMDTENLRQQVEVPDRWLEAIINGLAARVAAETPSVDAGLLPLLEQRAAMSQQRAWEGDGDGSPIQINPGIGVYTR